MRRTRVCRRYSSSSCTITRAPADNRGLGCVASRRTERYVSAINVKCLLFLLTLAPSILASRAQGPTGAKTFGRVIVADVLFAPARISEEYRYGRSVGAGGWVRVAGAPTEE